MDEEKINFQIRKFLKKVGIQSQQKIENAVKAKFEDEKGIGTNKLEVSMLLEVPSLNVKVPIKGIIEL